MQLCQTGDCGCCFTAYREPFLYTIHYNAVQVMHIADRGADTQMPPLVFIYWLISVLS